MRVLATTVLGAALGLVGAPASGQEPPRGERPALGLAIEPVRAIYGYLFEGPFRQLTGLAFDPVHRELFVCDSGARRIAVADSRGVPTFSFGGEAAMRSPQRIAVDGEGRILVVDNEFAGVRVFDFDGAPLPALDLSAVPPGAQPLRPAGIALAADGTVCLLDGANRRIVLLEPDGRVRTIRAPAGRDDVLRTPIDIDVAPGGELVVSDASGLAVQVFSPSGEFLRGWGQHDIGPSEFSLPGGIAVDEAGRIFVVDTLRQDVKVFDPSGEFLLRFGGYGAGPGAVQYPADIVSDRAGRVFVSERVGRRVQIFRVGHP